MTKHNTFMTNIYSVMDMTAEFYLSTIAAHKDHRNHDQLTVVAAPDIRQGTVAVKIVEGSDDISAPGRCLALLICQPASKKNPS
jgi:poly-beta-hydroxyalkanoate depolymerase